MDLNNKPIDLLVVDSSVLIRRAPLKDLAQTVYAVGDVVSEIRDSATRQYLQVLPFDFKLKEPISDSIKFVTDFSKKTGDYSNLSAVDLKLIALTYQLCKENLSEDQFSILKMKPTKDNTSIDTSRLKLDKSVNIAGFYLPTKSVKSENNEIKEDSNDYKDTTLENGVQNLSIQDLEEKKSEFCDNVTAKNDQADENNNEEANEDDNDDEGWINPSNIKQIKKENQLDSQEQDIKDLKLKVACMTADFAMQNVLIQIGIPVISIDGLLIKKARSYVFKCITCHKVTTDMSKKFCPNCGYKTLDRYIVTVDSDGNKVFKGRRKPLSTKGLRFSLPMPHGGKHPNYPQLSEDQPIAQNLPPKKALVKNNPLDPDYICQSSPFAVKDVYSRASKLGIRSTDQYQKRFNKRK